MLKTILIFFGEEYVEISAQRNFCYENICGKDFEVVCDGENVSLNGTALRMYELMNIGKLEIMLFENNEKHYSFNHNEICYIGKGQGKDILIDEEVSFSIGNGFIEIFEGFVYINGRKKSKGRYSLDIGDTVFSGKMKTFSKADEIICSGTGYECKLCCKVSDNKVFDEYPVYKKSPRIIKKEPTDTIEILDPPQKEKRKKGEIVKMILPPAVMICVMVAVSILMGRGIYVLISAVGMVMSLVFSITTFFSDRKERKENEKNRQEAYNNYLLNIRKELNEAYCRQKESLMYHNPSVSEIMSLADESSSRLYERAYIDNDFLCVSLGFSDALTSYTVKYKNNLLDMDKDELKKEMLDVVPGFLSVKDVPVVIDLKETHLGIVGGRKETVNCLNSIIAQLCYLQSYHDIEIIMLIDEKDYDLFEWVRWFPHFKVKNINISGLISGENQRDQILGNISQILKQRRQKNAEGKNDGIFVPHYIFIVDYPKLLINHSIMEYLQGSSKGMGFSMIYTTNTRSNLPENIKTVLNADSTDMGELLLENGILTNKKLNFEDVAHTELERLARMISPVVHNNGVSTHLPDNISFLDMYKVKNVEDIPIKRLWSENSSFKSLAVPLGVRGKDDYVYLDLHEKAHGPHGLVAGTTGSGKSEILQSYILSLAVNFHPYEVGFLLIDYKGGGMANLFEKLPHLLGTITNLDGSESMRALASIKSELARRQRIFNNVGVNNINQYTKMFKNGETIIPMPHLFIISDEFAELKKEQPEFMSELVSAARIGRSLGVHLILATQKPTGVVDEQIWSNSKFKLALKVQDESDSREVIKTPDAARITQPGRAYLQVGNNEIYELFQSAWSGASYSEKEIRQGFDNRVYLINSLGQGQLVNNDLSETSDGEESKITQLDAVVGYINSVYSSMMTKPVEKPWLPPLDSNIVSSHISRVDIDVGKIEDFDLKAPIGIVDIPEKQLQEEYVHDFEKDRNLAIFGASGFGKSTTELLTVLTLAVKNSPEMLNFYILDFGNSALIQLKNLPHTSDYISFDEDEKRNKFVNILTNEIRRRKTLFAQKNAINFRMYNSLSDKKIPAVIVVIDNYDVIKEIGLEFEEFIAKLSRDGTGVGIYMMFSASRINSVKYAVLNSIKNRIVQFMFEESEINSVVGRTNYKLPEVKGRALVKLKEACIMQCYLPVEFRDEMHYVDEIGNIIESISINNTAPKAQGIRMIPEVLSYNQLVSENKSNGIAFGMDTENVEVQIFNPILPIHLIVGGAQSGKTNVLKLAISQLKSHRVFISDSRSYELKEYIGNENITYACNEDDITHFCSELEAFVSDRTEKYKASEGTMTPKEFYSELPDFFIIIDDVDRFVEIIKPLGNKMETVFMQASECGAVIIASTMPTKMRGYDNITKYLKEAQSAIILGNPVEQTMFSVQSPRGYKQVIDMGFSYCKGVSKQIKIPLCS